MDLSDFNAFKAEGEAPMIRAKTFLSRGHTGMGTLLYGYTCTLFEEPSSDFHVYLKGGLIHRLLYRELAHEIEVVEYDAFHAWDAHRLIPDKRVYPECTSVLMARLLRDAGVEVPFTRFDEKRYERLRDETFQALIREEIEVIPR